MSEIVNALVPIEAIQPHPRNYKLHPPLQIADLKASHQRFSQYRSVVIWQRPNGEYIQVAGHGILEAMRERGVTHVRADILPMDTPEEDIEGIMIADNQLPLGANENEELLAMLLQEQQDAGFDLHSLGTDDETLRQMLEGLGNGYVAGGGYGEGEGGDDYEVDTDDIEIRCRRGELWQLGKHRLLVDDCTKAENVQKLMQGEKADMLFTDPPYGVDYTGGHFHSGDVNIKRERERLTGDKDTAIYPLFLPVVLPFVDGPCYMWFADSRARDVYDAVHDSHCEVHALLIWHKTNATYAAMNAQYKQRHEPLLYFKPKGSTLRWSGPSDECTIWELPRDAQNTYHPTQKPISLSLRAIGNHEADTVLDVFGGSGSTLIACERASKTCYMMELDEKYATVCLNRWEAETGQTATLLERVEVPARV